MMPQASPDALVCVDGFGRVHRALRLSVTDPCNLRCRYCMPNGYMGGEQPRADVLAYEEIEHHRRGRWSELGVKKFRLTGGEPLVRRDLRGAGRIARTRTPRSLEDLALSTNGVLLAEQLDDLVAAGLARVNVQRRLARPRPFRGAHPPATIWTGCSPGSRPCERHPAAAADQGQRGPAARPVRAGRGRRSPRWPATGRTSCGSSRSCRWTPHATGSARRCSPAPRSAR